MTDTLLLPVDANDLTAPRSRTSLETAAGILRQGGTVAFPTETVYGLGANALDAAAVSRIFEAKQRPAWDPLIVHVADKQALQQVIAHASLADRRLIDAFWPGALTLLLPKADRVPMIVTAGRAKVGVRMPAHPVAQAMLQLAALPLAAPSANSFSRISPTTAQHVLEDLAGRIDAILDGGPTSLGLESTVVDANATPPVLYRPGMISLEQLQQYIPDLVRYQEGRTGSMLPAALPSPGVGLRHYAPRAKLMLLTLDDFISAVEAVNALHGTTGALLPGGLPVTPAPSLEVFKWGRWDQPDTLARDLYSGLRELDLRGVQKILCPLPAEGGLGSALRDRLEKAAMPRT